MTFIMQKNQIYTELCQVMRSFALLQHLWTFLQRNLIFVRWHNFA